MKKHILLFIALLCFGLNYNTIAQKKLPYEGIALVTKIVKIVKQRNSLDEEFLESPKTPLPNGGQVRTEAKSLAVVNYYEGSLIRVRENSILNIYSKKEGKKLIHDTNILKGTVQFEVKKQGEDEFKFTTPTAVASIRGTDGLIFSDSTVTRVFLESGELYIESITDPTKNGRIVGGEKVVQNEDGSFTTSPLTNEEKEIIEKAKIQTTKKVIIRTPHGDVEIEYFSSDQK